MSKTTVVVVVSALAAVTALFAFLGGPTAAATAFFVCAIGLGAYVGAGWGASQSAETEKYREKILGKRQSPTIYYDGEGNPLPNYSKDSDKS
ncbi:hypothetical protein ACRB8A_19970 (plasmid) [Arthrobacter sp. G.S.26]|uniref:hypothetical protein n=1 Tax=Arthrobacter sp. G.S.26 TaxID=3433706 RepID=UPI003D78386E